MSANRVRIPSVGLVGGFGTGIGLPTLGLTVVGAAGLAYVAVDVPELYRAGLATAIGLNLIVLGIRWPRATAVGTLLFLPFLALIRRLLIAETGWISNDPLVLVGPVVALFLVFRIYLLEGRRMDRDLLAKLALGMLALTGLLAFNPFAAGGLMASLGGLIFLGVPLLWFFVGRALGDTRLVAFLLEAVVVIALIVAVYGLFQTELAPGEKLPQWDQDWFEVAGYGALRVGDEGEQIRPFSTFASNGEYSAYLSVAIIIIFALAVHRRFLWVLALPILAFAVFSSGGRASMALTALAAVVLIGVRTRHLALGLTVVVLGIGAVYGLAFALGPTLDRVAGLTDNAVTKRNISGLLHPLDPGQSSGLSRWDNLAEGVLEGVQNPTGSGTGAANLAGRNLSDSQAAGRETDHDIADVFVSLGPVGGLLFLAIIVTSFRAVFSRYARTSSWTVFATAGILIVMFGSWLNGGMYALAPLMWFLLGWASRPRRRRSREPRPSENTGQRRRRRRRGRRRKRGARPEPAGLARA